jgi:tetratricopeptide (TPR) repeat protein
MISGMFGRIALILLLVVVCVIPGAAQSRQVVFEPNLRLFTMMAALNVAGYDVEFGTQYHPVRAAMRKYTEDLDPDLVARLRAFYSARKGNQTDDTQLARYISLALTLTDAPNFRPVTREENMPPDARSVMGFADLLREFYEKAHISQYWTVVRLQYEREIARQAPVLRDLIVRTEAYLRVPLGNVVTRNLAVYLELAAPINTVNVRSYQDNYYVVLGDSTNPRVDDVRHAYLHFQLDSLVAVNASKIAGAGSLLALVSKADGVDPAYTSEFHIMATESLIRAVELRMDRVAAARARENVDMYYRSGLLLTPYFYEALQAFEQNDAGTRDYFPEMLKGIQLKTEQQRFQETFNKIPVPQKTASRPEVPQPPPAPPANPTRDLLKEGEAAFNAGDNAKAQAAFEKVLSDFDRNNGSAFYGLALIASKQNDDEQAKQYFERTIRSDSAEPSMKVWSYIFLGRIFDLECSRERAVEYYQQAVKVGDNTRNAQAAAREGVQKPYGDACR